EVETIRRRRVANCRLARGALALDALVHPHQRAHVLAIAWPEEVSVLVLAEPVDVEDLRRALQLLAHRQPVTPVVTHVVAAERQPRHRRAARLADFARRRRRLLRGHSRADEDTMLPVERLVEQRGHARAPPTEDEGRDRHALRIFPMWRDRGALAGRSRE